MNKKNDRKTPLDKFENEKFADQPPTDELKIEAEQEKKKRKSQDESQSEE